VTEYFHALLTDRATFEAAWWLHAFACIFIFGATVASAVVVCEKWGRR
jgi:hypothetical protein